MSSAAGRFRSPKRSPSASTVSATSSSESVVCVITAIGLPPESSFAGVLGRLDHHGLVRALSPRPDHLDVVGMADERDQVAAVGVAPRLGVHLRDERADGVDDAQAAALAVLAHRRRDAVGGEDADLARGDLVLVVDEDRAEPLEPLDDVVVVDDLVADVDRRPVLLEQDLDDLDRAVDAGAERARRGEQDLAYHPFSAAAPSAERARGRRRRAREAARRGARSSARQPPASRSRRRVDLRRRAIPSGRVGVSLTARRQPRRRPLRASGPLSRSTASAPVARAGARRSAGSSTIGGSRRGSSRAARPHAERAVLPEHRALDVDDPRRVDHGRRSRGRRAARPRGRTRRAVPRARRSRAPSPTSAVRAPASARGPLLGGGGAGERQPVSVHAMLRTVSLTLPVASKAAEGSKPEWIAQCSQRGSLPGP